MFTRAVAVVALAAATLVSAQNSTSVFTVANPGAIDLSTRVGWCTAQQNACAKFCQNLAQNSCSTDTLTYECSCTNNESPDLTQYADTLPYNICQYNFATCNSNGVGNAQVQAACVTNIQDKCGKKKLSDVTPIDAASQSSSTSAPSSTGTASPSSTATNRPNAAAPLDVKHAVNGAMAIAVAAMAYMV